MFLRWTPVFRLTRAPPEPRNILFLIVGHVSTVNSRTFRLTPAPTDIGFLPVWRTKMKVLLVSTFGTFWKFFDHLALPLQHRSCLLPGETCRHPGLRNSHNAPFHPVTSYSGNNKKKPCQSLSSHCLTPLWNPPACFIHYLRLFTASLLPPRRIVTRVTLCLRWRFLTEVVPENIWHESDVEKAWVDVHTLINISDRSHTDRRLSFLLSCAVDVVWVAGSLPQIFTSGECHTHPSPGVCCQRWRCLAAHLLTQHRAAKFSSLSGHTCG